MLHSIYASIMSEVIRNTKIYIDRQTSFQRGSATSEIKAVHVMDNTLASIRSQMSGKHLKMNDLKQNLLYKVHSNKILQ